MPQGIEAAGLPVIESNAVEVHIHNLRAKIGKDAIQTLRGVGYRMGNAR